jgi:DNA primase
MAAPSHMYEAIWVVEGELCADMLTKLGILATTSGSMDSVLATDWLPLADHDIVIWPDNDEAGLNSPIKSAH